MHPQQDRTKLNQSYKMYDFMKWGSLACILSSIGILSSSILLLIKPGFNWGLEFTGGTVFELSFKSTIDLNRIRDYLNQRGLVNATVQNFGSNRDLMIRLPNLSHTSNQEIINNILGISDNISGDSVIVKRVECIGPTIGNDLIKNAILTILSALLCVFTYVGLRFAWSLATGTILALVHDLIITLGVLSLYHVEIDTTTIIALMSVIGYSLNDSIVVLDRIRENLNKKNYRNIYDIFNISITQTFHRTIMTTTITLIVIVVLWIFGGTMLRSFSLTLFTGVLIGTASSIYVASALALKIDTRRDNIVDSPKKRNNI